MDQILLIMQLPFAKIVMILLVVIRPKEVKFAEEEIGGIKSVKIV